MRKTRMRVWSILLTVLMLLTMLPVSAMAAEETEYVAEFNGKKYISLAEAVEAVTKSETKSGTVTLLKDTSGAGIGLFASDGDEGVNLVIDFAGYTYTCIGPAVGSPGYESQAFHLEKDNTVTLKNGAITANSLSVQMMFNNYCDLTVSGMTIDATQGTNRVGYVMSNNCGNVVIEDTTVIAKKDGVAFDVYGGFSDYSDVTVTVTGSSVIDGKVEVARGSGTQADGSKNKNTLNIEGGTFHGAIAVTPDDNNTSVTVSGGSFTSSVKDYVEENSSAVAVTDSSSTKYYVGTPDALTDLIQNAAPGTTVEVEAGSIQAGQVPDGVTVVGTGSGSVTVDKDEATYTVTVIKAATCTANGIVKYTNTTDPSDYYYVAIPASHKWQYTSTNKAATCGEAGEALYTCSACKKTKTEVIEATGEHNFVDSVVDATCTEPMKAGLVCSACGATSGEMTNLGDPLGHDYQLDTSLEGYKAATCTEGGVNTYKCSRCEETKEEETEALGHSWDNGVVVDNCEGQYVLYTCTVCKATYTEETGLGEVTEHDWALDEEASTAATCTEAGKNVYTCSKCGATKEEEVEALGHDVVATVVAPTCSAEGYTTHTCSRCDYAEENTDPVAADPSKHLAGEGVVIKAPTCTTAGVKKNVCSLCGAAMGYETMEPAHSWDEGTVTEEPTCTETGIKTYTCTVEGCGATKEEEEEELGHSWDAGEVTTEPNCGTEGVKTYTCTRCDATKTESIPVVGEHNFVDDVIDATCTEPQKAGLVCSVCGATSGEMTELGDPLGHDYQLDTSLEGYKAATCTEGGVNTYKCSRCEETKEEETEALGHSWDNGVVVDNCEGQYVLYTCTVCKATYTEETGLGEVTEHDWVLDEEASTAATCTEAGKNVYTCSKCGATKEEEVEALGHDVVATVVAPTCSAEGYTTHTCSRCDYAEENTDPVAADPSKHLAGEGVVIKAPTCTTAGVKKNVCSLCGAAMGYETMEPAHSWDEGTVTEEPTCTETGIKTYTCTVEGCGATKEEEEEELGHSWDAGEVTTEPNCGTEGVKTYTCTRCDATKTESIPVVGEHNFVDDVIDATCTEPQKAGLVCSVCGATSGEMTELGDPLGHDYQLDTSLEGYKAATCTEGGVNTYKCSRCEETKEEETEALGHSWDNGVVVDNCEGQYVLYTCTVCKATYTEETGLGEVTEHDWVLDEEASTAATCTEAGKNVYTCSKCGATKEEEVEALGHDVVATVVAPTCSAEGYTTHTCSRCDYAEENTDPVAADPSKHLAGEGVVIKAPTCTTAGVKKNVCSLCGAAMGYETMEPAHSWDEGTVTEEPTCTETGIKTYTCTVEGCGATKEEEEEELGHSWDAGEVTTEPNCGTEGVKTYTCTRCDATKTESIPVVGEHNFVDDVIDATCTEPQKAGLVCSVCGATSGEMTELGDPLGHDYQLDTSLEGYKAATCTEGGVNTYKCSRCEETKEEETEALGHSWDNGVVHEADCEHGQYVLYTCTVCKDTKTEETGLSEALGHTFTTEVVAPTCSAQGYTREYCTVCGYEKEHTNITEKDPNAHTYDMDHAAIIREPTCAVPGVAKVTCTGCGYTTYQTVTAEHTWDEGTETKPATCTEEGVLTFECEVCHTTKTEPIQPTGHKFGNEQVSDDGLIVYKECETCGYQEIIAILGCEHKNTETKDAVAATCTEDGYTGDRVCQDCGATIETGKVIPATGHTEKVIPGKAATCTETGLTEGKKCSVCGEVLTAQEEIPATGHTEEVIPGKEATCTETGLTEGQKCSVCGEVLVAQEEIPMVAHNYVDGVCTVCDAEDPDYVAPCTHENTQLENVKKATCTEAGYTGDTVCTDCGETLQTGTVISATGHTVVTDAAVEATCTTAGKTEGSHCSICGTVIEAQQTVPAKSHTVVEVPEVPATEESAGTTAGTKCSVCGEILSGCETIPPLSHEHVWDGGVETQAPTCTEAGEMTYTCSACGETRVETIAPKGHSYKVTVSYNSDYTEVTYTYTCSACSDSYSETFPL